MSQQHCPGQTTYVFVSKKNCDGINLLMGLGKGITASCSLQNNTLVVNYLEGDWIGKIIGLAVGWILCFIPFITAIIGCSSK